jgi:TonB-linked SusC/RagA family outer membrane protein
MYKIFTARVCGSYSRVSPKFLKVMKLTVVLWLAAFLQVSAAGYAQKINLSVKNASLKEVLTKIGEQSGFSFIYNSEVIKVAKPVSLSVANELLSDVLTKCFQDQPLTYIINGSTVVIKRKDHKEVSLKKAEVAIPPITVTGTVTDSKGQPLPGVSVRVKGTTTGIVTNVDGKYSINVPDGNSTLTFSFIGFTTQEVVANNRTQINITLLDQPSALNEVVVVGYGSQKKSDVTGSIASVNEAAIKSVPASNLLSALQGQATGLDIQKSGGNSHPGATPSVLIRGQRSLGTSNGPLYIVDGAPYNDTYINDLNQDDVVSVQILKDASATAIYGSRGANGVILITTRRGKIGKPVITYSGYAGVSKPIREYDMMNGQQFEVYKKWAMFNSTLSNSPNTPNAYTGINDPKLYTDGLTFLPGELASIQNGSSTDWQKLIYKNGFKTDHQLGVSGGTESTQYAISAGFYDETGNFIGQSFSRYSLKLSIDQQLGKIFKVGVSSLNAVSGINGEGINPISQALRSSPLTVPYDANGNIVPNPGGGTLVYNPVANLVPGAVVQNRNRFNTFSTAYVEAQFLPHLKYRFNGGVQLTPETYGEYFGSATYQNLGGASTARNSNYNYHNYTLENLLIYDNTFAQKHHVNFTGLFSTQDDYKTSTSFGYNNILANSIQYYNPGFGSNLSGSGDYQKYDIVSYMGRINYDYDSKYLLTLTVRDDGASRLADGNKYQVFPSVAAGWNINQEDFLKNSNVINSLKLRLGYGQVGNSAVKPYQTLGGLGTTTYNYGTTNLTGTYPNNVPNPNLTWEKTATANIGLDFGILNNRISGSIDAYHAYTSNLLLPQNLPITSGYSQPYFANVGKTENKGLEIQLNTDNIRSTGRNSIGWTTSVNISFNRNKITALASGIKQDIGNRWFVGNSITSIYNFQRLGIWQNTAADSTAARKLGLTVNGPASVIGNIRVADLNGDNKINADDRTILGNSDPKFTGGITNRISYKGLDFVVVASFRVGGTLIASQFAGVATGFNVNSLGGKDGNLNVNYWTPDNHENYYPKPNRANNGTPQYEDLLQYFDASYLKIRTLSLGYALPKALVSKIGAKSLRIYTTANDAFILFSPFVNKYHGIDPESSGTLALDIPTPFSVLFGLNVSF